MNANPIEPNDLSDPTEQEQRAHLQLPDPLVDLIMSGALRPSEVQVLVAWLRGVSPVTQRRRYITGPFRTTKIAAECSLTVKGASRAKTSLVARGIFTEYPSPGRPSLLKLNISMSSARPEIKGAEDRSSEPVAQASPPHLRKAAKLPSMEVREGSSAGQDGYHEGHTPLDEGASHACVRASSITPGIKNSRNLVLARERTKDPLNHKAESDHSSHINQSNSTPNRLPSDLIRRRDDLSNRAQKLYDLFIQGPDPEDGHESPKHTVNAGEYVQVLRFLEGGVPDSIIADAILRGRTRAKHFGLVRWMVLKVMKERRDATLQTQAGEVRSPAVRESRPPVEEKRTAVGESAYSTFEGMPNAVAYRPVNPSLVQKWREMYPEEC